jgi:PIN domain
MHATDAILFIDANKYLDLYRTASGKALLAALAEQAEHIVVTQQVVNEVHRNMIHVAKDFLSDKFKDLKLQTPPVPDHLFGVGANQSAEIRQKMSEVAGMIKEASGEATALAMGILKQISKAEDEVSKALAPIFAKAIPHMPEELQRARERLEVGNPPGKGDKIGDGLTWEQLLTLLPGKSKLWIISRDDDYGTLYNGVRFLNHFMYQELQGRFPGLEVAMFDDIAEGIKDFSLATGVRAERLPSPDELQRIRTEENRLPPLGEMQRTRSHVVLQVTPDLYPAKDWKNEDVVPPEDMDSDKDMTNAIFVWEITTDLEEPENFANPYVVRSYKDALAYIDEIVDFIKYTTVPDDLQITMRLLKMPLYEYITVEGM